MSSKSLPIDEIVQKIVIKLQHSQLGNLIHDDAHQFFLSKLYLKHVADLLQGVYLFVEGRGSRVSGRGRGCHVTFFFSKIVFLE